MVKMDSVSILILIVGLVGVVIADFLFRRLVLARQINSANSKLEQQQNLHRQGWRLVRRRFGTVRQDVRRGRLSSTYTQARGQLLLHGKLEIQGQALLVPETANGASSFDQLSEETMKKVLAAYSTVDAVMGASPDELARTIGVTQQTAVAIKKSFEDWLGEQSVLKLEHGR